MGLHHKRRKSFNIHHPHSNSQMKYFIYRLEITDGEHTYYSAGICEAASLKAAIKHANYQAKNWYEDKKFRINRTEEGKEYETWEHLWGEVICETDLVEEIPEEHHQVLKQYQSYI